MNKNAASQNILFNDTGSSFCSYCLVDMTSRQVNVHNDSGSSLGFCRKVVIPKRSTAAPWSVICNTQGAARSSYFVFGIRNIYR